MSDRDVLSSENEPARELIDLVALYRRRQKNRRICRKLDFGGDTAVIHSSNNFPTIGNIMADLTDADAKRAAEEYELDAVQGEPLPGAKRWEYSIGTAEDTPEFYLRPPHRRPTRTIFRPIQAAPTSAFRTPQAAIVDGTTTRVPATSQAISSERDVTGNGARPLSRRISRELFPTQPPCSSHTESKSSTHPVVTSRVSSTISSSSSVFIPIEAIDSSINNGDSSQGNGDKDTVEDNRVNEGQMDNPEPSSIRNSDNSSAAANQETNTNKRPLKQALVRDRFPVKKRREDNDKS